MAKVLNSLSLRIPAGLCVWLIIEAVNLSFPPAALAFGKLDVDPSKCKTEAHGKFYVALGPTVLALPPPVGGILIDDVGVVRRPPPDPKQPVGCPDNPMQLRSDEPLIPFEFNGEKDAHPSQPKGVSDFTLYDTTPLNTPHGPQKWDAEEVWREFVDHLCAEAKTKREELPIGFSVCRFQQAPSQVHIEDWLAGYKAHTDTYQTPLGNAFSFYCQGDLYSDGIGHCLVIYALSEFLALSYNFEPYRGRVVLPIDQVVDFDQQLRRAIQGSIIENYSWPSEAQPAVGDNGHP